jgi:hypothetical protein
MSKLVTGNAKIGDSEYSNLSHFLTMAAGAFKIEQGSLGKQVFRI